MVQCAAISSTQLSTNNPQPSSPSRDFNKVTRTSAVQVNTILRCSQTLDTRCGTGIAAACHGFDALTAEMMVDALSAIWGRHCNVRIVANLLPLLNHCPWQAINKWCAVTAEQLERLSKKRRALTLSRYCSCFSSLSQASFTSRGVIVPSLTCAELVNRSTSSR